MARHKRKSAKQRLHDNLDFLSLLAKAKRAGRRQELLDIATGEQIVTICECIRNVLDKRVQGFPKENKKVLKTYKNALRVLGKPGLRISDRRQLLNQKGGFLPALLTPILAIAGSLIGELVRK